MKFYQASCPWNNTIKPWAPQVYQKALQVRIIMLKLLVLHKAKSLRSTLAEARELNLEPHWVKGLYWASDSSRIRCQMILNLE